MSATYTAIIQHVTSRGWVDYAVNEYKSDNYEDCDEVRIVSVTASTAAEAVAQAVAGTPAGIAGSAAEAAAWEAAEGYLPAWALTDTEAASWTTEGWECEGWESCYRVDVGNGRSWRLTVYENPEDDYSVDPPDIDPAAVLAVLASGDAA